MMVEWDGVAFRPRARFDAAMADQYRRRVPLEAKVKERRSLPQNNLYWAVLQSVVDATGKWPTSEALHWALRMQLGYIEEIASIDGEILTRARSTAFGKMSGHDYRVYFDSSMTLLTEDVTKLSIEELLDLGKARLKPIDYGPSLKAR